MREIKVEIFQSNCCAKFKKNSSFLAQGEFFANQVVLQVIKKSNDYVHLDVKTIEFHLQHYEIPLLSLC